jgi:hypothetical protein
MFSSAKDLMDDEEELLDDKDELELLELEDETLFGLPII